MKPTKRQLAAQFVEALDNAPLEKLAQGLFQAALEIGYTRRDFPALIASVEHELHRRYDAVEIRLKTAHKLNESVIENLASRVAEAAVASQYSYVHDVDPSLLGGFEAETDGVAVRSSIKNSLKTSGVING